MTRPDPKELLVPGVAVAGGVLYLVAGLLGDRTGLGVCGLVIMLVFALALWLARRRSETVQGLLDRRDERINSIDLTATALTGGVLVVVLVVGFAVSVARGGDGSPYDWLAAVGGVTYIVSVIVLRLRR